MLLTKSLKSIAQNLRYNNNIINKNVPCPLRANFQRQYCSEKFKIVDTECTSVLTIRKTLKAAGVESKEGFSFIKTLCPVCDFPDSEKTSSIYINKVSGTIIHEIILQAMIKSSIFNFTYQKETLCVHHVN